ncbi:MAG: response regulator [Robiginitomaculum sp.]|nr:response regulator [Robiginitomaculum sp.]
MLKIYDEDGYSSDETAGADIDIVQDYDDFNELEQLLAPDESMDFETISGADDLQDIDSEGSSQAVMHSDVVTQLGLAVDLPRISNLQGDHVQSVSKTEEVLQPIDQHNPDRQAFTRRGPRANDTKISPDQLEGLNILVVEDIEANQIVIRSLLEPVGCNITIAENGKKGLEMLELQMFDVVLMDIRMPIMNGIEATQHIRNTPGPHQNVPIIALTADASAENNAQCLAAGANVFLTKPVIVSELFSSIRFVREKYNRTQQSALSA